MPPMAVPITHFVAVEVEHPIDAMSFAPCALLDRRRAHEELSMECSSFRTNRLEPGGTRGRGAHCRQNRFESASGLCTDVIEVHKPGAIQQALGKRSRFGGLMRGAS